ncbi:MAG: metallophosphoesterase [Bacteroidales bacterium]|nr:metallophosphoesterase [Bacteroidales bacterium]
MARHFTKQEIEEIRSQLGTDAVRDTDFEETEEFVGDDWFVIVQNGRNKKIQAAKFRSDYNEIAQQDHATAVADHTKAVSDSDTAAADHTQAEGDHERANLDHTRAEADHTRAGQDSERAAVDHNKAASDHSVASSDHSQAVADNLASSAATTAANSAAENAVNAASNVQEKLNTADADHTRATNDHTTAVGDHTAAANDHEVALLDHDRYLSDHEVQALDHSIASEDHVQYGIDHTRANNDHSTAVQDHENAASDRTRAASDHSTADSDHEFAVADHSAAVADHATAVSDHSTATSDHNTAGADHTLAVQDHTTAGADHTLAGQDHSTAAGDHTQAGSDHERAESDHTVMAGYDTRLTNVETDVSQLGQEAGDLFGKADVYNGSNGNPANAKYVRTAVVATRGASRVIIKTNRPNTSGCHYTFGYALTSDHSDIGSTQQYSRWGGPLAKVDANEITTDNTIDISAYSTAVGIAITIGEYEGNTQNTLRDTDFSAFDVILFREPGAEEISSQDVDKAKKQESILLSDSLYGTQVEQSVLFERGAIAFGSSWSYSNSNYDIRTPQNFKLHLFPGDVVGLTDYSNVILNIGLRFVNGKYMKPDPITSDYTIPGECDVAITIRYSDSSKVFYITDLANRVKVIRNNTIGDDVVRSNIAGGIALISNGSNGNHNNANSVHTEVKRTNGARYAIIKVSRPNSPGCYYSFGYAITANEADIGYPMQTSLWNGLLIKVDHSSTTTDYIIDLSSYPTAVGISFTIAEYNASKVLQTLRISDFDRFPVEIICDPTMENFMQEQIEERLSGGIVNRNAEREIALEAICRYRKVSTSPQKDIEMLICTDSHYDGLSVDNAIDATNGFSTIDCFVHCGDIMPSYYRSDYVASFKTQLNALTKPGYIVIGNHDVGNAYYIGYCCDHAQAYDAYIKPMVDKGWLASGEYTANKPYWHHDLADYKIRLIGLYEYDDNLDFNENYWRAITYNSNLPNIALNTAYSIGTQVNVPGYTDYSFEAVQALTTPANFYTTPEKFPSYKVRRGDRVIRQEQAQWFLDTLLATPANYGIVVILHNPFADDAQVMDVKFSQFKSGITAVSYSQNDMETDLIGGALAAFASGSNYEENVVMKGDAAYMNTQVGGTYSYTVSKNFASKNTGVSVLGLLGGHSHRDLVWKKGDFVQITPVCATTNIANATGSDIRRADEDGLTKDSLTVISFASGRIGLAKIGVNVTEDGYPRDYEVIKTN